MLNQRNSKKSIFELADCFAEKIEEAPDEDLDFYLMYLANNFLSVLYKWGTTKDDHEYVIERLNAFIHEMNDTSNEQYFN